MKDSCDTCRNYSICIIRMDLEKILQSIQLKHAIDDGELFVLFGSQTRENLASKCSLYELNHK